MVKIGLIAFALLFISCSDMEAAPELLFCRLSNSCTPIYSEDKENGGFKTEQCLSGVIVNSCTSSNSGGGGSSSSRSGQGGQ